MPSRSPKRSERSRQSCPPMPHVIVDGVTQRCARLQHPVAHVATLQAASTQMPLLQRLPAEQPRHKAPPVPQAESVVPLTQTSVRSMHPVHAAEVHTAISQRSASVQAEHTVRATPQASRWVPAVHPPSAPQQPVRQLQTNCPLSGSMRGSRTHCPPLQRSATGHSLHSAPPRPQVNREVPATHSPAVQQPSQLWSQVDVWQLATLSSTSHRPNQRAPFMSKKPPTLSRTAAA